MKKNKSYALGTRKIKWVFAIVDVIEILKGSVDPGAYWRKLKERLKKEGNGTVTDYHGLTMTAAGKQDITGNEVMEAIQFHSLDRQILS